MIRIVLISLLFLLVSCSDLEPEMGRKTISLTFTVGGFQPDNKDIHINSRSAAPDASSINTELILLSHSSVIWHEKYWSTFEDNEQVYDGQLTDLSDDTVILEIPLDTPVHLFVYRFQETYGENVIYAEDYVDEYGISGEFILSSEDQSDEMVVNINLFTLDTDDDIDIVIDDDTDDDMGDDDVVEEEEEDEIIIEEEEEEEDEIIIEEEETYTVFDVDGNGYSTVWWNDREWLKQNLRTTHYADGTPIYFYSDWWDTYPNHITIDNLTDLDMYTYFEPEEGYDYDNYVEEFGLLYNFYTWYKNKPLCPTGWEIPTPADWNVNANTKWKIADELFLTAGGMGDSATSMLYDDRNYGYWSADDNATTLPEYTSAIRFDHWFYDEGYEVVNGKVRILDVTSIRCIKVVE